MTTDSPNRPTSQNENQQTTDNGAYSGSEKSLFAELRDKIQPDGIKEAGR